DVEGERVEGVRAGEGDHPHAVLHLEAEGGGLQHERALPRWTGAPERPGMYVRAMLSSTLLLALPLTLAAGSASTAAPVPARVVEEARQVLDQLVSVDTSHGHETDALGPVAERLRA